jgi:hypothetical protein
MYRVVSTNPIDRFRNEVESRLYWFKCELASLSPVSPDYETEKLAIQAASEELRRLIRQWQHQEG